jgi:AraC-like DNA-binding protein
MFRRTFGMPPKTFARVLRFDAAVRRLRSGRVTGWADLAASCGYADQAHLAREFRALSGSPPSEFAMRLLPDGGGVVD